MLGLRSLRRVRYTYVLLLFSAFVIGWIYAAWHNFRGHEVQRSETSYQGEQGFPVGMTLEQKWTIDEIQNQRRQRIREHCSQSDRARTIEGRPLGHFIVDTEHKMFMCLNFKAGSRQLKRVIGALTGVKMGKVLQREQFKWGDDFSPQERLTMSKTYFTAFFTREPLVRLLSAFLDKFWRVPHPQYRLSYGRKIIAKYRQNPSQESLEKGNDVKFSEFVQFILDDSVRHFNEHWQLATFRCFPCAIEYDFIARFEDFQHDLADLLKTAGAPVVSLQLPFHEHNTTAEVRHYYSQISREQILQLAEVYRPDYEAFGYPFPGPLFKDLVK